MFAKKFKKKHFLLIIVIGFLIIDYFTAAKKVMIVRKIATANEWILIDKNPEQFLRGYSTDEFPPPRWSKNGACFVLNSSGFGSDLMTRDEFEEFELKFDWKFSPRGNSGILFAVQAGQEYSYMSGPEIQLLDDSKNLDGKVLSTSLGALYGLSNPNPEAKKNLILREYNSCHLIVKKDSLKFFVNDILITDISLEPELIADKIAHSKFAEIDNFYKKRLGHILFQDHGSKTEFCNIRIQPILLN